ncbi:MAG: homoserine lactone transporter [SAR324 cluster bacterium]|uniref:Homoserine lactone transporter n=1 Tax=SAR324 cluster bacterium TaxID=2024889 RepID=A0A2A4SZN0_9DELT|nr:MAG: homoserine lactone transporter [SAR324 cluster bacterium]
MDGILNFEMFIVAAILLNLTPGADTIYILGRSIAQGKMAGVVSVMGISTGILVHTFAAAVGLSALLSTSALAFSIVKYGGAAYLVYLGLQMILTKSSRLSVNTSLEKITPWKIYRQGVVTNVLNPKVALFFLSFLPQFVDPNYGNHILPFLYLGIAFVITGTLWCLMLAIGAALISGKLSTGNSMGRIQKITGGVFMGLGVKLALSDVK